MTFVALGMWRMRLALILGLACGCFSAPIGAIANADAPVAQIERVRINNPDQTPADSYFAQFDRLRNLSKEQVAAAEQPFGGPEGFDAAVERMRAGDPDELAKSLVESKAAADSATLQIGFMRDVFRDERALAKALQSATSLVRTPDGKTQSVPVTQALQAHIGMLRADAAAFGGRAGDGSIAGRYAAEVTGSSCPFTSGPMTLVQHEYRFEGVRDGKLLLFGATKLFALTVVQRYATVKKQPDGNISITAPDEPTEIYSGIVGGKVLTLAGVSQGKCAITLVPRAG
jgi:hypothetical protein